MLFDFFYEFGLIALISDMLGLYDDLGGVVLVDWWWIHAEAA